MAWSLSNTVPYSTNADLHTAMVYLFDTALPALSTISTAAHPGAAAFKRTFSRTTTNLLDNGAPITEYFWVDWASTTPTSISVYEDATYTTTPGDLATDTTNVITSNLTTSFSTESVKFWTSDQNPNALLVTRGKTVLWWEMGFTGAYFHDDAAWDGSYDKATTTFYPGTRTTFLYGGNRPQSSSGVGGSEYSWRPALATQSGTGLVATDRLDMNCSFMWTGGTGGTGATAAGLAFHGVGNDVGYYRPTSCTSSEGQWQSGTTQGALWLVNGRYYLTPCSLGVSYAQMVFDFGASEPDLT